MKEREEEYKKRRDEEMERGEEVGKEEERKMSPRIRFTEQVWWKGCNPHARDERRKSEERERREYSEKQRAPNREERERREYSE